MRVRTDHRFEEVVDGLDEAIHDSFHPPQRDELDPLDEQRKNGTALAALLRRRQQFEPRRLEEKKNLTHTRCERTGRSGASV